MLYTRYWLSYDCCRQSRFYWMRNDSISDNIIRLKTYYQSLTFLIFRAAHYISNKCLWSGTQVHCGQKWTFWKFIYMITCHRNYIYFSTFNIIIDSEFLVRVSILVFVTPTNKILSITHPQIISQCCNTHNCSLRVL